MIRPSFDALQRARGRGAQALSRSLSALDRLLGTGVLRKTGLYSWSLSDSLGALADMSGTGIACQTATDTWAARTITASGGLTISNGGGVAGNPAISTTGVLEDLNTLGAPASDGQIPVATGAGAFAYESGATLRTSIGVGTGDNVQVARLGAGVSPSFILHAQGSPTSGLPVMKVKTATAYAASRGIGVELTDNASATADYFVYFEDNEGGSATLQGSISGDGGTGVDYNVTSDAGRKDRIADADLGDPRAIVRAMRVREWGGPDPARPKARRQRGFLAQELHAVYPEAVIPGHEVVLDDGTVKAIPWQITPMKLIPVLAAALREQDAEIADLRAAVDALSARLAALEAP